MSNDDFRRELNSTFEQMSGSPSPALRDRVRSTITQAPEARGPYWIAGVAACVIAALLVGVLFVANPLRRPSSNAGVGTPTASPSTSPSAGPSPTQGTQLPAFTCDQMFAVTAATTPARPTPAVAFINALRTGTHGMYDRVTVEFSNGMPHDVQVSTHGDTTFTQSPSGMSVTLKGRKGVSVVIHGADLHTAYSGSQDIVTGDATIAEVKRLEDFEGVVQLGLGVNGTGCYRAFYMTNPDRLVIDVQAGP